MTLDLVISSPVVLYSNSVLPVSPSPLTSLAAVLRPSRRRCCRRTQSVETKILSYSTSSTLLRQRQSSSGASMTNLVVLSPSLGNLPTQTLIIPLLWYREEHRYRNNWYSDFWYYICSGAFSAQTPEDTILFSFGSVAIEKFGGDPPENTQLFSFSGEIETPLRTFAEQPTGTINVSGQVIERREFDFVGSGSFTLSDSALEAYSAQTPEDTILFGASELQFRTTIREVFFGVLTFSGAATNEQFTGDPPEETILFVANGDAHTNPEQEIRSEQVLHLYLVLLLVEKLQIMVIMVMIEILVHLVSSQSLVHH